MSGERHGYGCPYHYGPISYGPEAPDDRGEDCTCEVCTGVPRTYPGPRRMELEGAYHAPAVLYPYRVEVEQRGDRCTTFVRVFFGGTQLKDITLNAPTLDVILQTVKDEIENAVKKMAERAGDPS